MDISFKFDNKKFNYRVCAVILSGEKILVMQDSRSPFYYLPGGRVKMGETVEEAIKRELFEELGVAPRIIRPLWLNQAFFNEDVDRIDYHELCLYFLIDISDTDIMSRGEKFTQKEEAKTNTFEWIEIDSLKEKYFYPLFLKTEIFNLPTEFTLRTEYQ